MTPSRAQKKRLNLGCGGDVREGWVNLDIAPLPGVDVVHDLGVLPLPFADDTFEEILCHDVLEHLDYIPLLEDLRRILKKEGTLIIRVPHFTSKTNFIDPTHIRQFSVNTWDFFAKKTPTKNKRIERERSYYFNFAFDRIEARRISFEKSSPLFFFNRIAEWITNRSPRMQEFYESTFLSRIFPADNILVHLIK